MSISRREFLALTSVTLAATGAGLGLSGYTNQAALPNLPAAPVYGRPLYETVLQKPGATGVRYISEGELLPLYKRHGDHFESDDGVVPVRAVQPLQAFSAQPTVPTSQLPALVELVAPQTHVRQYAASDAPPLLHLGQGAVLYAVTALYGRVDWYGLSVDGHELLGWAMANGWKQVHASMAPEANRHVVISSGFLDVSEGDTRIARIPAARPHLPPVALATVTGHTPALRLEATGQYIAPWNIHLSNGFSISGAYWHNDFGYQDLSPYVRAGNTGVHINPGFARWLYHWLPVNSSVQFRD